MGKKIKRFFPPFLTNKKGSKKIFCVVIKARIAIGRDERRCYTDLLLALKCFHIWSMSEVTLNCPSIRRLGP